MVLGGICKKMSIVTHLMRAKGTDEAKAGTSMTSNAYEVCGSSKRLLLDFKLSCCELTSKSLTDLAPALPGLQTCESRDEPLRPSRPGSIVAKLAACPSPKKRESSWCLWVFCRW